MQEPTNNDHCDTWREPSFVSSLRLSSIQGRIWRWSFSDFVLASHLQSQGLWTIGQSTTAIPLRTVLQLCLRISQETWGPWPAQHGCKCSPCQIPLLHVHRNPPLRGGRWRGGITAPGKEWATKFRPFVHFKKVGGGGWWGRISSSLGPGGRTPLMTSALLGMGN